MQVTLGNIVSYTSDQEKRRKEKRKPTALKVALVQICFIVPVEESDLLKSSFEYREQKQ